MAVDLIACDLVASTPRRWITSGWLPRPDWGITERENIDVVGATVAECYKKMWVPYIGDMSTRWPEYKVLCDGACSSCQALLAINMETLKPSATTSAAPTSWLWPAEKMKCPTRYRREAGAPRQLYPQIPEEAPQRHPHRGCPPSEPLLYMSISNGELVHGKGGQMSEYIRPRMAADQPCGVST